MLSTSAKVVGPDNKTELTITTDKSKYSWGDTVIFNIDVKNVTDEVLTGIKINSFARIYMKMVQQGELPVIPRLEPGETKTVQIEYYATRLVGVMAIFFPIIWIFSPVARIAYDEANFNYEQRVKVGAFKYRIGFEVEYNVSDISEEFVDTDGDGLSDEEEDFYKTDKTLRDTDGDSLTDLEELLIGTDPLVANPITSDTDSDGLSDIDEVRTYNTDPQSQDTDRDELTDYDEIFVYHTNPNKEDTDGDGLRDGFEVKHGLNPLKASTDGKHNDSDVKIEQEIDESGISEKLRTENIAPPSISGAANGELTNNVFVSTSTESTLQDNRSIVGMPVCINGDDDYITGLTLSFDLSSFSGDLDALTIVKINVDGNFELIDSTISGSTISCELDDGGDYCIIDIGKFLSELEIDLSTVKEKKSSMLKAAATGSEISGQADVVFAIDTTGSMSGTINNVINNVTSFSTALARDYNVSVHFALVDYKDITSDGTNSTKVVSDGYQNWYSDVNSFISSVKTLRATGGGDTPECGVDALETARQLDFRRTASKFIILITDADYKNANNYGIKSMSEEIELLKNDGIHVSVVTSSYYASTYRALYESTGGIFANISNNSFSTSLLNLASLIGEETADGTWVILKHGYRYVKLPEIPSSGSNIDTDGDGLTDYAELGKKTTVDLSDFIKVQLALNGIPFSEFTGKTTITVYDAKSDPTLPDSDGDGINDKDDTAPWNKGIKDGYIGKLTLVSCEGDGAVSIALGSRNTGHAFLIYKSYVNDNINTNSFNRVLYRDREEDVWKSSDEYGYESYKIDRDKAITMGANGIDEWVGQTKNKYGAYCATINVEAYKNYFGVTYLPNAGLSKDIKQSDLENLINYFTEESTRDYSPFNHQCAHVATGAWNRLFKVDIDPVGMNTPKAIKNAIIKLGGKEIDLSDYSMQEAS